MNDPNKLFPDQRADCRYDECVALAVSDIVGNIYTARMDENFTYGASHHLSNNTPLFKGSFPYTAMQTAVLYGVRPHKEQKFNACFVSEDFEADFDHYDQTDRQLARNFVMNGVIRLRGYQAVCDHLDRVGTGVIIGMEWYESFNHPLPDGTLPSAVIGRGSSTNHAVAAYGHDSRGIKIKPWLGDTYGDGGYGYISEAIYPSLVSEAYAFDKNANRFMSLVQIALGHLSLIPEVLTEMQLSTNNTKVV